MTEQPTDVTARAIWQTTPCPDWCIANHHEIDGVDARECASVYGIVPLTSLNGWWRELASAGRCGMPVL
jgi:hypothetical protein